MLGPRASRIASASAPSSSKGSGKSGKPGRKTHFLSDEKLWQAWKRMHLKIMALLGYLMTKTRCKLLLGEQTFRRLTKPAVQKVQDGPDKTTEVQRMVRGELVGKKLDNDWKPKDKRPKEADPNICQHPENRMERASNKRPDGKGMDSWICKMCHTRWERLQVNQVAATATAKDTDLVMFGKHQGRTYLEILTEFPKYRDWVIEASQQDPSQMSPAMAHLAKYLSTNTPETLDSGPLQDDEMSAASDELYPSGWTQEDDALL